VGSNSLSVWQPVHDLTSKGHVNRLDLTSERFTRLADRLYFDLLHVPYYNPCTYAEWWHTRPPIQEARKIVRWWLRGTRSVRPQKRINRRKMLR